MLTGPVLGRRNSRLPLLLTLGILSLVFLGFSQVQAQDSSADLTEAQANSTVRDSMRTAVRVALLDSDLVADLNFKREDLIDWINRFKEAVEKYMSVIPTQHEFALVVTFSPNGPGAVQAAARPAVADTVLEFAQVLLNSVPAPTPAVSKYSLILYIDVNGGNPDSTLEFSPLLLLPQERERRIFLLQDIAGKRKMLRDWAKQDVIPLLAEIAERADTSFVGLNELGTRIKQAMVGNFYRVDELCNKNPNYWRGVTQLKSGNFLTPAIKLFCMTAEGRFDWANRNLFVMNLFADRDNVAGQAMNELAWRLNEYYKSLNAEVRRGMVLTDEKKFKPALALFDSLQRICQQQSAWLHYERYYTSSQLRKEKNGGQPDLAADSAAWGRSVKKIFAADPLYPVEARVFSGREAYLVSRRNQVNSLFKKPETVYLDLFMYSDIALDVGEYAFAAELLWLLLTNAPQRPDIPDREILLIHYIYALDRLGQDEVIAQFNRDFDAGIQEIETERKKRMETSPLFQRFERK